LLLKLIETLSNESEIDYMNELYLEHHGIKGMKWGVRRYQNPDGTLTALGQSRIVKSRRSMKRAIKKAAKEHEHAQGRSGGIMTMGSSTGENYDRVDKEYNEKVREPILKRQGEIYKRVDKYYDQDPDRYERELERADKQSKNDPQLVKLRSDGKKYVKMFNEAKIKDLKFSDVQLGVKYLKKYDLAYRWDSDEQSIRIGRFTRY